MRTYAEALAKVGTQVPEHLEAEAEVPVLTGMQRQGDILVQPASQAVIQNVQFTLGSRMTENGEIIGKLAEVSQNGVQVVTGEESGNTHWLHNGFESRVLWMRGGVEQNVVGYVVVPEGQSAMLIHTDEHGANGIGPGCYEIRRKMEMTQSTNWVLVQD